jgi:hypothetical protein
MSVEKKKYWVADKYINKISYRLMHKSDQICPRGSFHDSWEEAHAAIVAAREAEYDHAVKELKRAKTALDKAKKMTKGE